MRLILAACLATLLSLPAAAGEGDAASGEEIFMRFCKQCHIPIPGDPLTAPDLAGIVGRPVAAEEGYRYSDAFLARREEGMIWTEENLDAFLRHPRDFIPGSIMVFKGVRRGSHRDDLIAFLKALEPRGGSGTPSD